MEFLVFVLLLVLLFVTIGLKNRMSGIEGELRTTRLQMQELMFMLAGRVGREKERSTPPDPASVIAEAPKAEPPAAPAEISTPTVIDVPSSEQPRMDAPAIEPAPTPTSWAPQEASAADARIPPIVVEAPVNAQPPPPRPSFLERNPDLEKFIGENLINKIGIAILVLGLGLLLQYAIGKGYIGETAQTLIGVASGGVLLYLGHRLREKFRAFSSVLVGGGLAVLYFSIAIAFQQYHIIGQTAAFAAMVGITALGVLLTLAYDRRELAIIAMLGGFATPFLVSTGEGNYKILFTYLLILNAGMLVLANFKKWSILNILAFVLSWLLFGAWALFSYPDLDPPPVWAAMIFATAFYGVFFAMLLLYDLRHRTPFTALDYSLFLGNTAIYFGLGMRFLNDLDMRLGGLLCVLLAAVNVVFALRFFRNDRVPRNLVYLLIGVVLTFISLAAPVQLEGDHITLFWAAEGVLLLWFARRSGIGLVERTSLLVTVLMIFSLAIDLGGYDAYRETPLMPVVNRLFITGLVALIALVLQVRLWAKWAPDHKVIIGVSAGAIRGVYVVTAAVLGYALGLLELNYQLGRVLPMGTVYMAGMGFSVLYLLGIDLATKGRPQWIRFILGGLFVMCFLFLITLNHLHGMVQLKNHLLGQGDAEGHVLAHYITLALAIALIVRVMRWSREVFTLRSAAWNIYAWVMCTLLVVIASQELDHVILLLQPATEDPFVLSQALHQARTAGYPILWGLGSFLFMLYGMRARLRMIRVIALTLFGITLIKLFAFDIQGASEGARVAAFISLGVLLLVISFLYQKLKVILKDDADAPAN